MGAEVHRVDDQTNGVSSMKVKCPKCRLDLEVGDVGPTNGYSCPCGCAFWVDDKGDARLVKKRAGVSFGMSFVNAIGMLALVVAIMIGRKVGPPIVQRVLRGGASRTERAFNDIQENCNTYNAKIDRIGIPRVLTTMQSDGVPKELTERISTIDRLDAAISSTEDQIEWAKKLALKYQGLSVKTGKEPFVVSSFADLYQEQLIARQELFKTYRKILVSFVVLDYDVDVKKRDSIRQKYRITRSEATAYAAGEKGLKDLDMAFNAAVSTESDAAEYLKRVPRK